MTPTKKDQATVARTSVTILHLVTPLSQGKPLCGQSGNVEIGSYCEHLSDGEWAREVFGKDGKTGKACDACLTLYPSLLWSRPGNPDDFLNLQSIITIAPYPIGFRQDFVTKGVVMSEDFEMDGEPSVIGQRVINGKTALRISFHIVPKRLTEHRRSRYSRIRKTRKGA